MNQNRKLIVSLPLLALTIGSVACSSSQAKPQNALSAPQPEPQTESAEVAYIPGPRTDDIQAAINDRNAELRQCYMVGTFRNAQLKGTVNVVFTIDTQGRVPRATDAGSDIGDQEVVQCVLDVFTGLEFAGGSSSETEVNYPVHFGTHG